MQLHRGADEEPGNGSGKISAQLSPRRFQMSGDTTKKVLEASHRTVGDNDNMTTYTNRSKLMEIQGFDSPDSKIEFLIQNQRPSEINGSLLKERMVFGISK